MMAVCLLDNDDTWKSNAVPAKGAFGPLSEQIIEAFPSFFENERDVELMLTGIHYTNFHRKENKAGQTYPLIIRDI